jgi:outer membrane protein TolC
MQRTKSIVIALVTATQLVATTAWGDRRRSERTRAAAAPGDTEIDIDDADTEQDEAADRAEAVGLDDLIGAAVRRSPDLMRIKSDRRVAREISKAAAAPDQWMLGATVDWRSSTASRVQGQPVQQIGEAGLDTTVGARKTLPTGGALEVQVAHSRLYQRFAVTPQDQAAAGGPNDVIVEATAHVAVARVSVVQPLLRGRGATVSRASRHRAELEAQRAQIKARYDAAVLVHDLITGYWEVAYARAEMDVRRDSLRAAKDQLDVSREVYKAGILPVSALKAAEYALKVREESLLRSELSLEESSLATRQLAGLEVGPHDIMLEPTDPLAIDDTDWRVDDVLATARDRNPRIEGAKIGIALADIDVAVGEDATSPAVNFRASASAIGGGQGLGDAFEGIGQAEAYELTAGVAINYEIGGAAAALARAGRDERTGAVATVEATERDVTSQVVRAVHRVRAARKRAEVAAAAIEVSTTNLKAEQVAFKAGRSTSYNVLDRQTEVDEARLLRARAIADYHQAVARVELESGELLEKWGVDLRDKKVTTSGAGDISESE